MINSILQGRITKGVGGLYTVATSFGDFACRARGLFKKYEITPLVGDFAEISIIDKEAKTGYVQELLPRHNELMRPKVANIDQVIVVCSIRPAINVHMLDAFLISCELQNVDAVLCINKVDLDADDSHKEFINVYEMAKYKVIAVSAQTGQGTDDLRDLLTGKTSIFAGASGVGKSSIINALFSDLELATGGLSEKIGRGKHTTRHTSLIRVDDDTYVVDSPGFTSISIGTIAKRELQEYYPEFEAYRFSCFFNACIHITEPDCAVKQQVGIAIHPKRYEQYAKFIDKECQ
ncbi:MAG: ribosome small subunit-dependent GTPase A [Defluviitaleaceae bacterium]|nr:ribosome small subunit-dependent GTPase A [Defluviitaleaceae bacterium]